MATAATQLQITIITPQWLDPSEHEKENTSSSLQDQQEQEQNIETTNSNISITTTPTEDKTIRSQKIEPIHEWQKQKFDEWLSKNSFNMYPSRDEKEKLAEMLSASYLQITRLFANQRRRIHKKNKITIKENDDLSIPPPTTKIPENSFKDESSEIGEENIEIPTVERSICSGSGSERSLSPPPSSTTSSSAFTLEENNIAAICSAVADQIHFDQENKKCLEKKPIQKTKSKKRKIKKISWDEKLLETTVDEILHKIGRKDSEVDDKRKEKESQQNTEVEIEVDNVEIEKSSKDDKKEKEDVEMPPVEVTSSPNSSESLSNSLLSMVNEVVTQPPNALQLSAMGDVNPRLVEAMHLLNNGVSWTHPTILSVVIQIHQYQQQQREIQLAQQRAYLSARAFGSPMETSPPPGSESSFSHSSSKSTEELMSSLSPDECLAVNVLTDLANGW